jgi:steroid 5-alpha reductase family enzyme
LEIQLVLVTSAIFLFTYVSLWAAYAISKKRGDLADIAWGPGFALVAWISCLFSSFSFDTLIVNLLVTIWAARLAVHIYLRNRNRAEDFRYQEMKKSWGKHLSFRMYSQVFLLQGVILYVVSLPIQWINIYAPQMTSNALWVGVPFWVIGFLLETISDYQLHVFQKNPLNKGKLLKTGLWSYVRHPNYLGEILQWWAIWAMTLFLPYGLCFVISPLLITFLIIKVSGIAPLEAKMKKHPDFATYAKKTPSLIPFSLLNGFLYTLAWIIIVFFGAKGSFFIALLTFILTYAIQLYLYFQNDRKNLLTSIRLSIFALILGLVQETLFIHLKLLDYPNQGFFPPLWLLTLYPLFSLTLNSSLKFLNRNLALSFILGGLGAPLSYLSGEKLGSVLILSPYFYPLIFVCWGLLLSGLIIFNRRR